MKRIQCNNIDIPDDFSFKGPVWFLYQFFIYLLQDVFGPAIRAVAQQHGRVGDHAANVHAPAGAALRAGVGEEVPDDLVEPARLAQHDVHQLRLLARERQFGAQQLHRPGHRRQGIPDFVRRCRPPSRRSPQGASDAPPRIPGASTP